MEIVDGKDWARYLKDYPDVANDPGKITAQQHWEQYGQKEGRQLYDVGAVAETGGGGGYSGMTDFSQFQSPILGQTYALAKEQIAYASRRLSAIEEARRLGDMTGTLTSKETQLFDEMEQSAVANLKSQVNDQTQDVWNTALADLVNRGVLQGTVGEKILGTIGGENVRTIAEGVNTIRGQKNTGMLNMIEGNKNRALQWDTALGNEAVGLLNMGTAYSNQANQSQMAFAGLTSQENIAASNRALQEALAAMGIEATATNLKASLGMQKYGYDLDAATRLATAGMGYNASDNASKYGLAGNIFLGAAGLTSKYGKGWWDSLTSIGSGGDLTQGDLPGGDF